MWIYLQYLEFVNTEDACKNSKIPNDLRIFAHPKDGRMGLWLRSFHSAGNLEFEISIGSSKMLQKSKEFKICLFVCFCPSFIPQIGFRNIK